MKPSHRESPKPSAAKAKSAVPPIKTSRKAKPDGSVSKASSKGNQTGATIVAPTPGIAKD